ncbi:hypothetical protein QQP08_004410 [Theobroma cacao]|nr:hypothetical protein QQP08_004410 [Theobroma cacao]
MQNPKLRGLLLGFNFTHARANTLFDSLLFLLPSSSSSSSSSNARFCHPKRRRFCGYAAEQFSDDEYECDFESHKASSSVANIDEWKWKLSMLLRSENDQEIVSRDKRDRRDYEQISNLANRMGLYRFVPSLLLKCMEKWLLQARFLFLTIGQIWMISGHSGR